MPISVLDFGINSTGTQYWATIEIDRGDSVDVYQDTFNKTELPEKYAYQLKNNKIYNFSQFEKITEYANSSHHQPTTDDRQLDLFDETNKQRGLRWLQKVRDILDQKTD